jgi:hypothetical protein
LPIRGRIAGTGGGKVQYKQSLYGGKKAAESLLERIPISRHREAFELFI